MNRLPRRDEEGAALVMALVFLSAFSILIAVLLGFADTNFRATVAVRDQRAAVYAVDGAVESAVAYFRANGTCPGAVPAVNGLSAAVTCAADGGAGSTPANLPPVALLTRASGAEAGVRVVSGALTRVRGGAFSDTTIDVSSGSSLEVAGAATARTGCPGGGTITATGGLDCDFGDTAPFPHGAYPTYPPAAAAAPPFAVVPSCPASGPVVLAPGTFTDVAALNALFSACVNRVFHFVPGVYLFNFTGAGSHVWQVHGPDTVVVGGTLPAGVTTSTVAGEPVGRRCDPASAAGVQFVFGGDSRVVVDSGEVELCASHDPTQTAQQIAVYGLTASDPPAPAVPVQTTVTARAATAASTQFAPAAGAQVQGDGVVASATLVSSSDATRTATLALGGYTAVVPAGSTITSASVRVRHREQSTDPLSQLDLTATVTGGAGATTTLAVPRSATDTTSTVALPAAFLTAAQLTNLSVSYKAETGSTKNQHRTYTPFVDEVAVDVVYTPPAPPPAPRFDAVAGCLTTAPYDPSDPASCALVRTGGSRADFAVHGTVYAPTAALDIHLVGVSYQVFGRGLVARHLRSNVTPSSTCAGAVPPVPDECYPFQLPSFTPASQDVVFTATSGGRRVRALVRFRTGLAPQVLSWSAVSVPA